MNLNEPGVNAATEKDRIPDSRRNKQSLYSGFSSSGLKDKRTFDNSGFSAKRNIISASAASHCWRWGKGIMYRISGEQIHTENCLCVFWLDEILYIEVHTCNT